MYANCTILHGRQTFLLKVERSLSKPWQIGTKGSAQSGWKAHLVNWSWRNASWSKKVFVTKVLTDVFITLNPSFFGWANYLCSISEFGTMFQLYFQCLNCMRLDLYIWWLQQDDIHPINPSSTWAFLQQHSVLVQLRIPMSPKSHWEFFSSIQHAQGGSLGDSLSSIWCLLASMMNLGALRGYMNLLTQILDNNIPAPIYHLPWKFH